MDDAKKEYAMQRSKPVGPSKRLLDKLLAELQERTRRLRELGVK